MRIKLSDVVGDGAIDVLTVWCGLGPLGLLNL